MNWVYDNYQATEAAHNEKHNDKNTVMKSYEKHNDKKTRSGIYCVTSNLVQVGFYICPCRHCIINIKRQLMETNYQEDIRHLVFIPRSSARIDHVRCSSSISRIVHRLSTLRLAFHRMNLREDVRHCCSMSQCKYRSRYSSWFLSIKFSCVCIVKSMTHRQFCRMFIPYSSHSRYLSYSLSRWFAFVVYVKSGRLLQKKYELCSAAMYTVYPEYRSRHSTASSFAFSFHVTPLQAFLNVCPLPFFFNFNLFLFFPL